MFSGLTESLSRAKWLALLSFSPKHLGRLLNAKGYGKCPHHPGAEGMTAVHEHGVQFPCGCCRWLPALHRSPEEHARCTKCNPVEESNVISMRERSRKLTENELNSLRRQVGVM